MRRDHQNKITTSLSVDNTKKLTTILVIINTIRWKQAYEKNGKLKDDRKYGSNTEEEKSKGICF